MALSDREKARSLQKLLDSDFPLYPPLKQHLKVYIDYLNNSPDYVGAEIDRASTAFAVDMLWAKEIEVKRNEKT